MMRLRVFLPSAITALAAIAFAAPAHAQTATATEAMCVDGTTTTVVGKGACEGHGGLKSAARTTVHHKVTCVDGTMTDVKVDCKDHGGVKSTTNVTHTTTVSKKKGRPEDRDSVGALALCKDGLYSHALHRSSACTEHGGVEHFLHR